ncbi:MAG: HAD domain-containing protein [Candidatus Altimarinota bacterium]
MKKPSYKEYCEKYLKIIIFLDIDGVIIPYLNNENCPPKGTKLGFGNMYFTSDEAIGVLMALIKETDAKIVLSSSWRGYEYGLSQLYNFLLEKYNFDLKKYVIGKTPRIGKRGIEIKEWLNKNKDKYNFFLILEDEPFDFDDDKLLLDNTCQPNCYKGLVKKDFYICQGIINKQIIQFYSHISGKSEEEITNKMWEEFFGK